MEPYRIGRNGGAKEQMDIPPEAEADAGLPGGGKFHVAWGFIDPLCLFSGFCVNPVFAVNFIDIACPHGKIAVQGHDTFLTNVEVSAHVQSGRYGVDVSRGSIYVGVTLPDHKAHRAFVINPYACGNGRAFRNEPCIKACCKLRFPCLAAFCRKSVFPPVGPCLRVICHSLGGSREPDQQGHINYQKAFHTNEIHVLWNLASQDPC